MESSAIPEPENDFFQSQLPYQIEQARATKSVTNHYKRWAFYAEWFGHS